VFDTRQTSLCRVSSCAECPALGKEPLCREASFTECRPVPSVQHSVKNLFAERLALPSAALGKAFFAECPTKSTRQRLQHSAKPWIPVVQQEQVQLPADRNAFHVHLHEQCPPSSACRGCQGASEEWFDRGPVLGGPAAPVETVVNK
jgi:hypothetical protein